MSDCSESVWSVAVWSGNVEGCIVEGFSIQ
jgi:hypothetical protein